MQYKISKELIENVLGYKIMSDYLFGNYIHLGEKKFSFKPVLNDDIGRNCDWGKEYTSPYNHLRYNDFFFECIDWANKQDYYISLIIDEDNKTKHRYVLNLSWNDKYKVGFFTASKPHLTQQQAVFDACQWILDNKGKL